MLLGSSFERSSPLIAETKACCPVFAVTRRATLICPEGRASPQGCGTGKVTRTSKAGFGGGLGEYSLSPPPPPLFPHHQAFASLRRPRPHFLCRKCKGVRVARARSNRSPAGACKAEALRRAGPAPLSPGRQQARLRERECERRATYAVCIAGRAGGGGARAGRLGSARAGLGRSSPAPV